MQFEEAKEFILSKLRKELPKHLTYHSVEHINDVYTSCERIGREEGINGTDLKLLLTAALFHDSGFLVTNKEHEQISCEIARQHLPEFGYAPEQIDKICGMIMATRIPQTPHNKLEHIICDADLDYLGRDDFFSIGNKLFQELVVFGIVSDHDEWNKLQVKFLQNHNYFTPSSIKHRKPRKDEHLSMLQSQIN